MRDFLRIYFAVLLGIISSQLISNINYNRIFHYINKRIKYRKYYSLKYENFDRNKINTLILFHGSKSNFIVCELIDYINDNVYTVDIDKNINPSIVADAISDDFICKLQDESFDNIMIINCECFTNEQIRNYGSFNFIRNYTEKLKIGGNMIFLSSHNLADIDISLEILNSLLLNTYSTK